jgi:hypothetical protein
MIVAVEWFITIGSPWFIVMIPLVVVYAGLSKP